jgi:nitronate monooxygenase
MKPLKDAGCLVLADVASVRHAEKAVAAGVDGLVLLTAGAGGQTGWVNPFAFVRAVRRFWDGIVVMAGGMADGHAVAAAEALGCDLAYMGTKFIATRESLAKDAYKEMLVKSRLDDVLLTRAFTGLETNMRPGSIPTTCRSAAPSTSPRTSMPPSAKSPTRSAGRTSGAPATRCRASPTSRRWPS